MTDGDWRDDAACKGCDPDLFHPERGAHNKVREAKAVCAQCPVRAECLAEALENMELVGIWGGLSERQRRWLRSPTRRGVERDCRGCGNRFVAGSAAGKTCGECKAKRMRNRAPVRRSSPRAFHPEWRTCIDCSEEYVATGATALRCVECRLDVKRARARDYRSRKRVAS